jgi:hypothetical protein
VLHVEAQAPVQAANDALYAEMKAQIAAQSAETERKWAEERAHETARETALLNEHMCSRCGYDEPEIPLLRRMRARWQGRCTHGVWEPHLGPMDFNRCHLVGGSSCGMPGLELKQFARLRCSRCALEVPNFLRAQKPEAEPLVPLATQPVTGAVHVAPLLDVCYPPWPYAIWGAPQPGAEVRVRLGVFVAR